jgi:hypothetical protein
MATVQTFWHFQVSDSTVYICWAVQLQKSAPSICTGNLRLNSGDFTFGIKRSTWIISILLRFQTNETELLTAGTFHVLASFNVLDQQTTFDASSAGWTTSNTNDFFFRTFLEDFQTWVVSSTVSIS